MMTKPRILYWDSCVFLSYIDAEAGRVNIIESIFEDVQKSKGALRLVTSTISITEVAFASQEKIQNTLSPEVEQVINDLWGDSSIVDLIEYHEGIARIARTLMREAMANRYSLKPMDAIHLASAQWIDAYEVYTYDDRLDKFGSVIKRRICRPYVEQTRLDI